AMGWGGAAGRRSCSRSIAKGKDRALNEAASGAPERFIALARGVGAAGAEVLERQIAEGKELATLACTVQPIQQCHHGGAGDLGGPGGPRMGARRLRSRERGSMIK